MSEMGKQAIATLVTIVVSMGSFWMMLGRELPTRAEVNEQITQRVRQEIEPFKADIRVISSKLDTKLENDREIADVIRANSEVLNDLRITMASLTKAVEYLEKKVDGNNG